MISSRETVFLCTGLLLAAGAIITALLLSPDILPESMLTLLRSDNRLKEPRYVAITDEVEELLSEGKTNEAATLIARGRREAKDSLDYYQYEILDAKRYCAMMKADSFNASHLRLRHFLERQNGKQSPTLTMLRANALTQRGVYEVKMVGRIDSAVPYYQRALSLWRQLPNTHGLQLMTLTNLADAYRWMGQYDKSIVQYRRAMTLGDSIGMNDATLITIALPQCGHTSPCLLTTFSGVVAAIGSQSSASSCGSVVSTPRPDREGSGEGL
jgi:tetratricopeptide (TPR) repeat protein